jgi:hypothetical protein
VKLPMGLAFLLQAVSSFHSPHSSCCRQVDVHFAAHIQRPELLCLSVPCWEADWNAAGHVVRQQIIKCHLTGNIARHTIPECHREQATRRFNMQMKAVRVTEMAWPRLGISACYTPPKLKEASASDPEFSMPEAGNWYMPCPPIAGIAASLSSVAASK